MLRVFTPSFLPHGLTTFRPPRVRPPCGWSTGFITSPRTFGNYGAGSSLFWVDPELDMTFVFLSAGCMDEGDNVARFQKLSTMAAAAAV